MKLTNAPAAITRWRKEMRTRLNQLAKTLAHTTRCGLIAISVGFFVLAPPTRAADAISSRELVDLLVGQLADALSANQKTFVPDDAVVIESSVLPFVKSIERMREGKSVPAVAISQGFITLANQVAYARAKSRSEKGYFGQFIVALAKEQGDKPLAEPADMANRAKWPLQLSNDQLTQFNQIVATVIAIDLAHHYLGHYQKYKTRLANTPGQTVPINSLLTAEEWEDAAIAGALNALDCSIATDGIKTLFECIEKMPQRPAWTIYFMPEKLDLHRLQRRLSKLETGFFRGRR